MQFSWSMESEYKDSQIREVEFFLWFCSDSACSLEANEELLYSEIAGAVRKIKGVYVPLPWLES